MLISLGVVACAFQQHATDANDYTLLVMNLTACRIPPNLCLDAKTILSHRRANVLIVSEANVYLMDY